MDISESYGVDGGTHTDSGRESALTSIGPGNSNSLSCLLPGLLNQNITASGNSAFKGNANLVVAGERSTSLNDSSAVASSDVVNARLEVPTQEDASESSKRTWPQRGVNTNLSVW